MKEAIILALIMVSMPFVLAAYGYLKSYLTDNPIDDSRDNWMRK